MTGDEKSWTWFEDVEIGQRRDSDSYLFTKDEIKEFAGQFDPQPFHLDETAAAAGPFGRLAASGWHTVGIMMRLLVQSTDRAMPGLPSPGFENMEWRHPVFAGDRLRVVTVVTEKRPSRTRPIGIVKSDTRVLNQDDTIVMQVTTIGRYRRRQAEIG